MARIPVRIPLWSATAVGSGAALTSPAFPVGYAENVGLSLKVTSVAGAASVKIEFAISQDGTNFGSFDNSIDTATATTWSGKNPEDWHDYTVTIKGATHIKIKVTELASLSDSLVSATAVLYEATSGGWTSAAD